MRVLAKVCGLVRAEDAALAASAGADLLGFVSHPPSPRHCADLSVAEPYLDRAVLVQVADHAEAVLAMARRHGFRKVQPYLPAVTREAGIRSLREAGFYVLLPWSDEAGQIPVPADLYVWETSDFLLAGGMDAANLPERVLSLPSALRARFRGADAASRLEASPGVKDPAKVSAFIRTAHALESA
jgi:phosphoribosylanthranilate isomerase